MLKFKVKKIAALICVGVFAVNAGITSFGDMRVKNGTDALPPDYMDVHGVVGLRSNEIVGNYLTLDINADSFPSVTIYNNQTSVARYVVVYEYAYNDLNQNTSYDMTDGIITTGARTAWDPDCTDYVRVAGTGRIYNGNSSSAGLLEAKTGTEYR